MTALDEIQAGITRLADSAGRSVVGIGQRWGAGSGIVLGDGQVLTNAHNVRGRPGRGHLRRRAHRRGHGGRARHRRRPGRHLGRHRRRAGAAVGRRRRASVGLPVFALANPGGRGPRVTFGFVSGIERTFRGPRGRRISGSLEHTAPLLPGSSGGPVLDAAGHLLGINTNRLGEGFYLAIPADAALRGRVEALARGESASTPRLGVSIAPGHVARRLRRAVGLPDLDGRADPRRHRGQPGRAGGPGRRRPDRGGRRPAGRTVDDLLDAVQAARSGSIELSVVRGAEERTVQVSLADDSPAAGE